MRGKPAVRAETYTLDADHPRGCGENRHRTRKGLRSIGSPPRMRGKPKHRPEVDACFRITPADAGKTHLPCGRHHLYPDHPRGCGENCRCLLRALSKAGSPPQVRGKLRYNLANVIQIRITPAGAGKTFFNNIGKIGNTDHPRRCGENPSSTPPERNLEGSPPQVRGKHCARLLRFVLHRITPAGAGKTYARWGCCRLYWDHPRRCGENRADRQTAKHWRGSPPQVRGKLFSAASLPRWAGITPAGAGKTCG